MRSHFATMREKSYTSADVQIDLSGEVWFDKE